MRIYLLCLILSLSGCLGTVEGDPIPEDRLYYPSFLLQNQNTLYIVNTNLDLQYKTGNIATVDIPTGKITKTTLIPSLPGQMVSNSDFSAIIVTSQQNNSLLNASSGSGTLLSYDAPYFVALSEDKRSGLLGYLTPAVYEIKDSNRFSLMTHQSELQYFTLDSTQTPQIQKNFQVASCFKELKKSYRRVARIGGIHMGKNKTYVLVEFIVENPTDANKFNKHVFLIQTIPENTLCHDKTIILDITKTEKAQAARGLAVSSDETKAYVVLDENPVLISIDITTQTISQRTATCKGPTTLKLSPDDKTLLISCAKSNELVSYNAFDLSLFGKYTGGHGPFDILFDQTNPKQIFVSYQQDHKIGIFEYENASAYNRSFNFSKWLELSR